MHSQSSGSQEENDLLGGENKGLIGKNNSFSAFEKQTLIENSK